MEKIWIRKIQVKKLFGNISYDIDFTENNPISIITAPNGCGKTTILNLVSFILNPDYETFLVICRIPFDEFKCVLSNGKTIVFMQKKLVQAISQKKKKRISDRDLAERRVRSIFKEMDFEFSIVNQDNDKLLGFDFSEALMAVQGMEPAYFFDDDYDEISYYRGRRMGLKDLFRYVFRRLKQILKDSGCSIPVRYIKADRIQPVMVQSKNAIDYDETHTESPLKIASERIRDLIKDATEKYNEDVSQAKDKLPQMFLDGEGSELDFKDFMDGWSVYREELNQFQEIGLITPTEDFTMGKDISNVYKEKGKFLSTYLSAFKDTTGSLQDIYNRLNLFKQTLDERNSITGKKLVFGREGITLSYNNRKINLDTLSSGEKHDFIMFYNLIFNIKENGLVLVDEPEISLHIEWQETYLDKLTAICEMNGLQAIIATHSPNIVSSHFDYLADKGELNE